MQERVPLLVFLMVCLMTVAYSTIGIYTPAMPAIAAHFQASPGEVQLTFSAYLISFSLGQLIYGPLSDRYGRRPAIFVGLVVYVGGSAMAALSSSIEMLIAARAVQALGGCAGPVMARAIMRDLFDRDQGARLMSYVTMVMGIAPAFAPVFGGYLQVAFGWESIFWALSVIGGIVLVLFVALMGETHAPERRTTGGLVGMVAAYPRLMRSRAFIAYTLNAGCAMGTVFVYAAGTPFVFIELLGVAPDQYGWFTLIPTFFNLGGAYFATHYTVRLGGNRMMILGSSLVVAGSGGMLVLALIAELSIAAILGPMSVVLFGLAMLFPSAAQGAISVASRQAGAASSLNGFLIMAIAALAVVLVGMLPSGTQFPMVAVIASLGLASLLSIALLRGTEEVR